MAQPQALDVVRILVTKCRDCPFCHVVRIDAKKGVAVFGCTAGAPEGESSEFDESPDVPPDWCPLKQMPAIIQLALN